MPSFSSKRGPTPCIEGIVEAAARAVASSVQGKFPGPPPLETVSGAGVSSYARPAMNEFTTSSGSNAGKCMKKIPIQGWFPCHREGEGGLRRAF